MRIALVTNICTHYRVGVFEALARKVDVDFYFFSAGREWYQGAAVTPLGGDFSYEYLPAWGAGPVRSTTPALIDRLRRGSYDAVVKSIDGRSALAATYLVARTRRIPFVLWTGIWRHPRSIAHLLTFPITRAIYRRSDAVVVYGDHVARYLASLGVPKERIFPAHQAVDNARFRRPVNVEESQRLREELALGEGPIILCVGRLVESKGLEGLVDAVGRLTDLAPTLLLVGQGDLERHLRARVASSGVRARFWTRPVPNDELYRYYGLASVVVLPSVTDRAGREPWGLVVNEAMNQARPVVASRAVGAAAGGLVRDGVEGLVVPERDTRALATALRRVLEDRDLAWRLGEAGASRVLEFTQEAMADTFVRAVTYARCAGHP